MKCPICKSKTKLVFNKTNYVNNYNYVSCTKCKFLFTDPMPTKKELDEYYNTQYGVEEAQKRKVISKAKIILKKLKQLNKSKGSILEIGSSYGYFLNEAKKQGYDVHGIELSKNTSNQSKKKFNLKNIYNKNFETWKTNKKFDIIVLLDVIEHLTDINNSTKILKSLLKKDGYFVITTPNTNSLEYKLYKKRWEWISPPAHINLFNQKNFHLLMKNNQFKKKINESFKGDSAGNTLFHLFLTLRYIFADTIFNLLPKNISSKIHKSYSSSLRKDTKRNKEEFNGILKYIKKITNIFDFVFKTSQKKYGASFLAIYEK